MLHEILCIFCFWNLPAIHLQEQLETAEADERTQRSMSESQPTVVIANVDETAALEQNNVSTSSVIVSTPTRAADWSTLGRRCIQKTGSHRITSTRSRWDYVCVCVYVLVNIYRWLICLQWYILCFASRVWIIVFSIFKLHIWLVAGLSKNSVCGFSTCCFCDFVLKKGLVLSSQKYFLCFSC